MRSCCSTILTGNQLRGCSRVSANMASKPSAGKFRKYEARLNKWKQSKLDQFDSDDAFRAARLKKHSDRAQYEQHLANLIRKKIMKEKMAAGLVDGKYGHHNDAKEAREKEVQSNDFTTYAYIFVRIIMSFNLLNCSFVSGAGTVLETGIWKDGRQSDANVD